MSRRPPYQVIADVGSIVLVAFVIVTYRFVPGQVPDWAFILAWIVSVLVLVSVTTELYLMWRDYRAGILFPMRNASLFILLLSVVGLPAYVIFLLVTGQELLPGNLLLIPVLLTFATRNFFRVRIDNLSVRAKTGFRGPVEIPLFRIDEVGIAEDRIKITAEGERPIQLLRAFFIPRHWGELVERLREVG